jgi:hypothetical protein
VESPVPAIKETRKHIVNAQGSIGKAKVIAVKADKQGLEANSKDTKELNEHIDNAAVELDAGKGATIKSEVLAEGVVKEIKATLDAWQREHDAKLKEKEKNAKGETKLANSRKWNWIYFSIILVIVLYCIFRIYKKVRSVQTLGLIK